MEEAHSNSDQRAGAGGARMQVLSGPRSSGAAGARLSRASLDAPGSSLPATPVQSLCLLCGQGR
eukprot:5697531-Pyramimonas_sp.AAC.1